MVVGLKCQNGEGVSKLCRYILSKQCRFRTISAEAEQDSVIIYSHFKCNRTNECSRQSKQSEFTRLASILRYVTKLDIVIVAISYFDINHSLRSIFGEDLSMNLKRLLGSKRTNEYSWQNKQSKFTRLVPCLRYTLQFTVDICQSQLCLIVHLLRSIIREAFVV